MPCRSGRSSGCCRPMPFSSHKKTTKSCTDLILILIALHLSFFIKGRNGTHPCKLCLAEAPECQRFVCWIDGIHEHREHPERIRKHHVGGHAVSDKGYVAELQRLLRE